MQHVDDKARIRCHQENLTSPNLARALWRTGLAMGLKLLVVYGGWRGGERVRFLVGVIGARGHYRIAEMGARWKGTGRMPVNVVQACKIVDRLSAIRQKPLNQAVSFRVPRRG